MSAHSGCRERDGGIRRSKRCSRTELARVGGDVQLAGWGSAGWLPPSGRKWQGAQSCQGATELVFPGPTLEQMQSEAARRAGEPSGQGEEASAEGLGGHHLLAQTEPRRSASEVMRHHLDRQPGSVSGDQRHQLVAGVGPSWGIAQVEALLDELGQAKVPGQGDQKCQPGIGYQAVVVEGDLDPVGVGPVVASIGYSSFGIGLLFQNHYPRCTGAPSCRFRKLTPRTPSADSG